MGEHGEKRAVRGPVLIFSVDGGSAFPLTCFAPDGLFTDVLDSCLAAAAKARPLPVAFRDGSRGTIADLPASGGFDGCVDSFPTTGSHETEELNYAFWPPDAPVTFVGPDSRVATAEELALLPKDQRPAAPGTVMVLPLDMDGDGQDEKLFIGDAAGVGLVERGQSVDDLGEVPVSDVSDLYGAFAIGRERAILIQFSDRETSEEYGEGPGGRLLVDGRSRKTIGGMVCNP